jgi:hypothetical protein
MRPCRLRLSQVRTCACLDLSLHHGVIFANAANRQQWRTRMAARRRIAIGAQDKSTPAGVLLRSSAIVPVFSTVANATISLARERMTTLSSGHATDGGAVVAHDRNPNSTISRTSPSRPHLRPVARASSLAFSLFLLRRHQNTATSARLRLAKDQVQNQKDLSGIPHLLPIA